MKFVLRLKHWQLFLLTFAIPFFLYLVFIASVVTATMASGGFNGLSGGNFALFGVIALAWIVSLVINASWWFNMATGLQKKLPTGTSMKINRFYFAFFFPVVYFLCLMVLMSSVFLTDINSFATESSATGLPPYFPYFFLIIPIHFFAIACIFYVFYFIAKCLKSVELKRKAVISEYIAEFVLLWFSVIGVWFIQPRINSIFSDEGPTPPPGGPLDAI